MTNTCLLSSKQRVKSQSSYTACCFPKYYSLYAHYHHYYYCCRFEIIVPNPKNNLSVEYSGVCVAFCINKLFFMQEKTFCLVLKHNCVFFFKQLSANTLVSLYKMSCGTGLFHFPRVLLCAPLLHLMKTRHN